MNYLIVNEEIKELLGLNCDKEYVAIDDTDYNRYYVYKIQGNIINVIGTTLKEVINTGEANRILDQKSIIRFAIQEIKTNKTIKLITIKLRERIIQNLYELYAENH